MEGSWSKSQCWQSLEGVLEVPGHLQRASEVPLSKMNLQMLTEGPGWAGASFRGGSCCCPDKAAKKRGIEDVHSPIIINIIIIIRVGQHVKFMLGMYHDEQRPIRLRHPFFPPCRFAETSEWKFQISGVILNPDVIMKARCFHKSWEITLGYFRLVHVI